MEEEAMEETERSRVETTEEIAKKETERTRVETMEGIAKKETEGSRVETMEERAKEETEGPGVETMEGRAKEETEGSGVETTEGIAKEETEGSRVETTEERAKEETEGPGVETMEGRAKEETEGSGVETTEGIAKEETEGSRVETTEERAKEETEGPGVETMEGRAKEETEGSGVETTEKRAKEETEGSMVETTEKRAKEETEGSGVETTEKRAKEETEGSMVETTEKRAKEETEGSGVETTEKRAKEETEGSRVETTEGIAKEETEGSMADPRLTHHTDDGLRGTPTLLKIQSTFSLLLYAPLHLLLRTYYTQRENMDIRKFFKKVSLHHCWYQLGAKPTLSLKPSDASGEDTADCPADGRTWLLFEVNCYHFVHGGEDVAKSYYLQDAKNMCRGYDLLTVKSAQENDFIIEYSHSVWKGKMNVWLGLYYDSDEEVLKWHDDHDNLSYSNWEGGGRDDTDLPILDTCVVLHSNTGKWENVSCSDEPENGVVCKTKAVWISPPKGNPLLSALVIITVVLILVISAVVWFIHQRNDPGSSPLNLIEYHPPFRSPSSDQTCLVEAEEIDVAP
ncbi:hypothetical protein QQF64_032751 [Cirrhinus molitorella]|uniref:C-type lectin domain-containing protein n=1 Tax=Cirrhinus molitorella TaxID=172907 RepID=A0ABR3MRX9_9TELE